MSPERIIDKRGSLLEPCGTPQRFTVRVIVCSLWPMVYVGVCNDNKTIQQVSCGKFVFLIFLFLIKIQLPISKTKDKSKCTRKRTDFVWLFRLNVNLGCEIS